MALIKYKDNNDQWQTLGLSVTVDSSPTSGSSNAVASGGVYTSLASKANASDLASKATVIVSGTEPSSMSTGDFWFDEVLNYSITTTLTNVTADASNPTTIEEGIGTAELKFTANSGYIMPDSVTVTGATGVWTKATGTLVLSNATGNVGVTISGAEPPIYGAEWAGTSDPAWTRTDDAVSFSDPIPYYSGMADAPSSPFDNIMPWAGMTVSDNASAGKVVAIPKFWYKYTQTGSTLKLQICSVDKEGFSVSPAHQDRGDGAGERDVVYIGRHHCTSGYKSTSGVSPVVGNRSGFRSGIHNLGSAIWQWDWAMHMTIWMLYIVEFANFNCQLKIGYGCGNGSSPQNMGYTDSMPYHTGTTLSSRTTYGVGTQYRNIEGLWDNVRNWVDGCYYDSNGLNVIMNPNNFSDSSGGTNVGSCASGWISTLALGTASGYDWAIRPTATGGSDSTYICDTWNYYSSYPCLLVGGNYDQHASYGLLHVYFAASSGSTNYGSRLMVLPNN